MGVSHEYLSLLNVAWTVFKSCKYGGMRSQPA